MSPRNSAYFAINMQDQPGSLQRLLGTIRRRGFAVDSMIVTRVADPEGYRIEARLAGERSFSSLARHLANLVEVTSVSLEASQAPVVYAGAAPAPQVLAG